MKDRRQNLRWLCGLACLVAAIYSWAEQVALGQDCPCLGARAGWITEGRDSLQPDYLTEYPSGEFGLAGLSDNMAACQGPFCGSTCRAEGITFSAEITFVDVWQRDGNDLAARLLEFQTPAAPAIGNLDPSVDPSPLITFGYQTCEGLGFQVRLWEFDNSVSQAITPVAPGAPTSVAHAWDVMLLDVEVAYSSIYRQAWDITLSGGYRFVEYEEGAILRDTNTQIAAVRSRYVGNGVTGAVNVRRQLTDHLSIMANPRYSLLLGGESIVPMGVTLPARPLSTTFDARYILEAKLGLSWESPICGGGVWFARGGYEVQYWNDFVPPIDNQTRHASTVFGGLFFAVGIQR